MVFCKYSRVLELFKEVEPCELVNVHVFGMDPLFFLSATGAVQYHARCMFLGQ